MVTKQIIHNSEGSAQAEITSLEAKVNHLCIDGTLNYTYYIKHPTDNKWAVRYNMSGKFWDIVESHLNPNQINNLVDITNDWITEI
jgi:hypothetical protein